MLQCKNDIHFNPKSGIVPVFSPYSFSISQLFKPRFFVIYIYKTARKRTIEVFKYRSLMKEPWHRNGEKSINERTLDDRQWYRWQKYFELFRC